MYHQTIKFSSQWEITPSPAVAQAGPLGARCDVNNDLNYLSL